MQRVSPPGSTSEEPVVGSVSRAHDSVALILKSIAVRGRVSE
jgi:hypothetical protein